MLTTTEQTAVAGIGAAMKKGMHEKREKSKEFAEHGVAPYHHP